MGGAQRKLVEHDTNLEIYSLICFDSLITNHEELCKVQQRLRTSVNYSRTFDQLDQCEDYIRSLNTNDRVILVIDDCHARQLIPRIEQLRQVSSIYIHSANKNTIEQWAEQFLKVIYISFLFELILIVRSKSLLINSMFSSIALNPLIKSTIPYQL